MYYATLETLWQWAGGQLCTDLYLTSCPKLTDSFARNESRHLGFWPNSENFVFFFGSLKK